MFNKKKQPPIKSLIADGSEITGNISFTDGLRVDGKVVGKGTRLVTADYDAPRQRYAVLRAQRDAINRAAREVAEALNLSVAQDMSKL